MVIDEAGQPATDGILHEVLRELLVCPIDKSDLRLNADSLTCTACGRVYPIDDGIPNMLADAD